jgi:Acetyltransferase (GNAT) domain
MLRLEKVDSPLEEPFAPRNVFQTPEWLRFIAQTQGAKPVVARIHDDGTCVGRFTGLVVRRFGVPILGSPFQGWMTGPMGFDLDPAVPRREAVDALMRFAFKDLGCLHVEVLDRHATFGELDGMRARLAEFYTYELDLRPDEDSLMAGLVSSCRRNLRKSEREGVTVEEAHGIEFADEYYGQLEDVFAKQGINPPYGLDRVQELIRCLEPTGNLLMLRARDGEGTPIASGIFPAHHEFAYLWGVASWRSHQGLRPNEALFWNAIRMLKERGIPALDMGGGGDFKRKFGPAERRIPFVRKSRLPGLMTLRDMAARFYWKRAVSAVVLGAGWEPEVGLSYL